MVSHLVRITSSSATSPIRCSLSRIPCSHFYIEFAVLYLGTSHFSFRVNSLAFWDQEVQAQLCTSASTWSWTIFRNRSLILRSERECVPQHPAELPPSPLQQRNHPCVNMRPKNVSVQYYTSISHCISSRRTGLSCSCTAPHTSILISWHVMGNQVARSRWIRIRRTFSQSWQLYSRYTDEIYRNSTHATFVVQFINWTEYNDWLNSMTIPRDNTPFKNKC